MNFQSTIVLPQSIIVTIDDKVYNAASDHPNFGRLKDALRNDDAVDFIKALDIEEAVKTFVEGGDVMDSNIEIVNNKVFYKGKEVENDVTDYVKKLLSEGFDISPMRNFLENYFENDSFNSRTQMWKFIEAMGLTITPDGCFLAYKTVDKDYKDKYTGTIDNTPGSKPERMDRANVDDNPGNHCSSGYHVGALGYAGPGGWYHSYGDRVIICKVNPADVISVPNDHSCQKLRCCYYEPVGEYTAPLQDSVYSGEVGDDYSQPLGRGFQPVSVEFEDLCEDNFYILVYHKHDGTVGVRYILVEAIYPGEEPPPGWSAAPRPGRVTVELIEPEECAGEYRTLLESGMTNIITWDGKTPLDEMDLSYVPAYSGEEDDCEDDEEDDELENIIVFW